MTLEELIAALQTPEAGLALEPFWEESEACFPAGGPSFLREEELAANCDWGGLPPDAVPLLRETARRTRENPALVHLAWHCHRLLLDHVTDYDNSRIADWPQLDRVLDENLAPLFYLLVGTSAVPRIRAFHAGRGLPEAVTRATCRGVRHNSEVYRAFHGRRWGAQLPALYWLRNHSQGDLYEVGRFQYKVRPFRTGRNVFRHAATGDVVALVDDGTLLTADGLMNYPTVPPADGWTARLVEDESGVTGSLIAPTGRVLRGEVRLPRGEWQRVLSGGDPILDVHIPAGGGMGLDVSVASMRAAAEFFARYFPDRPFRGFACESWIFSPNLEEFLPPESNLVRLEREVYLVPSPSGSPIGLYFIFGEDKVDLATAPRDTSLRRAVIDHLLAGRELRVGGMFLLPEDLDRFGTQPYRANWPPKGLREHLAGS
jgi:hypothetical protein